MLRSFSIRSSPRIVDFTSFLLHQLSDDSGTVLEDDEFEPSSSLDEETSLIGEGGAGLGIGIVSCLENLRRLGGGTDAGGCSALTFGRIGSGTAVLSS